MQMILRYIKEYRMLFHVVSPFKVLKVHMDVEAKVGVGNLLYIMIDRMLTSYHTFGPR